MFRRARRTPELVNGPLLALWGPIWPRVAQFGPDVFGHCHFACSGFGRVLVVAAMAPNKSNLTLRAHSSNKGASRVSLSSRHLPYRACAPTSHTPASKTARGKATTPQRMGLFAWPRQCATALPHARRKQTTPPMMSTPKCVQVQWRKAQTVGHPTVQHMTRVLCQTTPGSMYASGLDYVVRLLRLLACPPSRLRLFCGDGAMALWRNTCTRRENTCSHAEQSKDQQDHNMRPGITYTTVRCTSQSNAQETSKTCWANTKLAEHGQKQVYDWSTVGLRLVYTWVATGLRMTRPDQIA